MLSEGKFKQLELFPEVGTIPEALAKKLGPEWTCKFVADQENAFDALESRGKSWSAEMHDEFFHKKRWGTW